MKVAAADFSYKAQKDAPAKSNNNKDKQKIIKKTQKLNKYVAILLPPILSPQSFTDMWGNSKLADWDDDDPSVLPDTSSRWDKVVILKHMFTLAELEVIMRNLSASTSPSISATALTTGRCRKIPPLFLTSRRTSARNVQNWARSPM